MAWVYLAEDINEGRLVAIKILYPQFSEDLAYIQRFNREAKLASLLSDPHIVPVLDYGATRDVHYLVMEYIEGQDLRSIIDARGNLPVREALHILEQLAGALEHAHLHGVVHRDIKPQNLMITSEGVLKVLDFGIARARMLPSLTQSGFVGSPYYISPEQAMGEDVDIRTDIYSAGIVLYEMLSGSVPYDAASPWSIISQHIASQPPKINLQGSQIPEAVETLLRRMIAKRPEDRFETPTTLREAITCVLEGRRLPGFPSAQPPAVTDRVATAEGLYQRACQAIAEEDWQRAVDLLNQVIKLNPQHTEAPGQLVNAGRQARLAALHAAARRAMEAGRWQEAADELGEIISAEPNYRDAATLLARAQVAQQSIDLAQLVSSLYDEGVAHTEAGMWKEAARCLRRAQQLSPGYKQTESLLAQAERHLRFHPEWLLGGRLAWPKIGLALVAVLAVTVLFAGVYMSRWSSGASSAAGADTSVSQDPAQIYAQAQTAFRAADWDRAIQLLDRSLAVNPNDREAAVLREQAKINRALQQSLNQAQAAYSSGNLDEAIEVLDRLRRADAGFRTADVQALLCDAHLQRGRVRLGDQVEGSDTTAVEAALEDFEEGLLVCPNQPALSAQADFANRFILALQAQALEDWDTLVEELTPILTAEADYANQRAASMLYTALVKRGELRQQAGDLAGALEDFTQAVALDEGDSLGATARRDEILRQTSAPQPGQTLTRPAFKYAQPAIAGPQDGALYRGEFTSIALQWQPVGVLAGDEYYDVTVMHYQGEEARYWGGAVRDTSWQVPVEAGLGQAANDRFYWWVTVRQANTAPGPGQLDLALSPPSETRTFYWAE